MSYEFFVKVEVTKTSGPFASRDDIEAELVEALQDADPGSISPADSEYETLDWFVEVAPAVSAKKATSNREWLDTIYEMLSSAPTLESDEFLQRARAGLGRYLGKVRDNLK